MNRIREIESLDNRREELTKQIKNTIGELDKMLKEQQK